MSNVWTKHEITRKELHRLYVKEGLSTTEIEQKTSIPKSTVWRYLKRSGILTRRKEDAVRLKYAKRINFGDLETLAYVLGVLLGDGSISKRSDGTLSLELGTIDHAFAWSFAKALERLGLSPWLGLVKDKKARMGQRWMVIARATSLCKFLRAVVENHLEEFVVNSPTTMISFLKGFYESEGGCSYQKTRKYRGREYWYLRLFMSNTDKTLIDVAKKCMERLGIAGVKLTKCGKCWRIYLNREHEIKKFLDLVEPSIKHPFREGCAR